MSPAQLAYLVMVIAVFGLYALVLLAAFALSRLPPASARAPAPRAKTTIAQRPSLARSGFAKVG